MSSAIIIFFPHVQKKRIILTLEKTFLIVSKDFKFEVKNIL